MLLKPVLRGLLAIVSFAALCSTASAATVDVQSFNAGWYSNTGATPDLTNIIDDSTRNNYFAFDLSGISGTVTAATLTIFGGNGNTNAAGASGVTYSVFDVSTNVTALTTRSGGIAAFNDLASGLLYGSTLLSLPAGFGAMPEVVVDLAGGLGDINSALGGFFAVGGTGNQTSGFLWISSNQPVAAQLSLTVAAVPVPAALPMMLGGLAALLVWRRRRARA